MDFSEALRHLKIGGAVERAGWNGRGMFVYRVEPGRYPARSNVAKAFWGDESLVPYAAYYAIKSVDGNVAPWVPSQTDLDAEDWRAVEIGIPKGEE